MIRNREKERDRQKELAKTSKLQKEEKLNQELNVPKDEAKRLKDGEKRTYIHKLIAYICKKHCESGLLTLS